MHFRAGLMFLACLCKTAGAADSPLVPADAAATGALDWNLLAVGKASLAVLNKSGQSISVTSTPLTFACSLPCTAITLTVSPALVTIGPMETQIFLLGSPAGARPGDYNGALILKDASGATPPYRQQIWVRPLFTKVSRVQFRSLPCGQCVPSYARAVLPNAFGPPPATTLFNDAGQSLYAWWKGTPDGLDLQFDPAAAVGVYKGDIPWGPPSAKSTIAATVTVSDVVLWPLLVILGGILLAFLVKRYLGLSRIVLDLRRRDAELGEMWDKNRREFARAAEHQPFAGYSIAVDVEHKRTETRNLLDAIARRWLSSSLDTKDADYSAAVNNIASLQGSIAAWPTFATTLARLRAGLHEILKTIDAGDRIPATSSPQLPAFAADAEMVLRGIAISIDDFTQIQKKAADAVALTSTWTAAYNTVKDTTIRFRVIDPGKLSDPQKSALEGIEQNLVTAWKHLFDVKVQSDLDAAGSSGSAEDSAETSLRKLEQDLGVPLTSVPLSFRSLTMNAAAQGIAVSDLPLDVGDEEQVIVDDHARARILRDRIRRGDSLSLSFALAIAIVTGLNSYYLGQPFGTLKDYAGLFLWAAGTKATLDIVGLILDKLLPQSTP